MSGLLDGILAALRPQGQSQAPVRPAAPRGWWDPDVPSIDDLGNLADPEAGSLEDQSESDAKGDLWAYRDTDALNGAGFMKPGAPARSWTKARTAAERAQDFSVAKGWGLPPVEQLRYAADPVRWLHEMVSRSR